MRVAAARARGNMGQPSAPVAGYPAELWLDLWACCHNTTPVGFLQWCWPEGGGPLEEYAITIQVFRIITGEFALAMSQQRGR